MPEAAPLDPRIATGRDYGNPDPEWRKIEWRQHLHRLSLPGAEVNYAEIGEGEPIVFVGAASAHREAAFDGCRFVMDYLKTRAPFWKKEDTPSGPRWVEGRCSDQAAAQRWQQD